MKNAQFEVHDTIKAQIALLENARYQAMLEADDGSLRDLLSPRLSYVHSNGVIDSKETYLETIRAGRIAYLIIDTTDVAFEVLDRYAVMITGRIWISLINRGVRGVVESSFTNVWVHESGRWQLLRWQSTSLPRSEMRAAGSRD